MINEITVRRFFKRLDHRSYGLTELAAFDAKGGYIKATGFFNRIDDFVAACSTYNKTCNLYVGRNPRRFSISADRNNLNEMSIKRAKDIDIDWVTGVSLDIDPIRPKGCPASNKQVQAAIQFGLDLQLDLGGDVYKSGNGVLVLFLFEPFKVNGDNRLQFKMKYREWMVQLRKTYKPESYGLVIDHTQDKSRLVRVIGTFNHKAGRISAVVREGDPLYENQGQAVKQQIESIKVKMGSVVKQIPGINLPRLSTRNLPLSFLGLLKRNRRIRKLWENPDLNGDTSRHDWILGLESIESGIMRIDELAAILCSNPHGKFRKNRRIDYLAITISNLIEKSELRDY